MKEDSYSIEDFYKRHFKKLNPQYPHGLLALLDANFCICFAYIIKKILLSLLDNAPTLVFGCIIQKRNSSAYQVNVDDQVIM